MGRAAQNIVEIGQRLIAVKDAIGHGRFGKWLRAEFGWSHSTANRMMQATELKINTGVNFQAEQSALYLLSDPSTPEVIRDQFTERANAGEVVTHQEVKRVIRETRTVTEPVEGWGPCHGKAMAAVALPLPVGDPAPCLSLWTACPTACHHGAGKALPGVGSQPGSASRAGGRKHALGQVTDRLG